MALRLHRTGHTVTAWNRTADKLTPLKSVGIQSAETPAAAISSVEGVVLMLSDADAIAATVLTDSVKPLLQGRTIIQMGTIAPAESKAIATERASPRGRLFGSNGTWQYS